MQTTLWPPSFLKRMSSRLGEGYEDFLHALETPAPVSIRINSTKVQQSVMNAFDPVPWCETGYYLPQRPLFTADPLLHAGAYYVQEAGSMFIEQAIRQYAGNTSELKVLDLCAAPGGKSTHLLNLLPADSLLVSNEVIRSRAHILKENISKWGKPNVIVTNNDPKDFKRLQDFFDIILIDAPCSGEGLFRRDPEAANEWSEDNIKLCSLRQQRILHDVWPALKPGGILLYSTCTYEEEENESLISHFISDNKATSLPLETETSWHISDTLNEAVHSYRFYPHRTRSEGFFCSVLQKNSGTESIQRYKQIKPSLVSKSAEKQLSEWLQDGGNWRFIQNGNMVNTIPEQHFSAYCTVASALNIVSYGCQLAELIRDKAQPLHELALSVYRQSGAFHHTAVSQSDAIRYLRRDDLRLPAETPQGIVLVTYKGIALGFGKWLGNRFNNYYPKEWRILKQIQDDALFSLF